MIVKDINSIENTQVDTLKLSNTVSIKLPKAKSYNLLHSIIPDVGLGLQKI